MEEDKKETVAPIEEEVKPVMLARTPVEFELVFQTPDGVLNEKEYLVWLGNLMLEVKEGVVGN